MRKIALIALVVAVFVGFGYYTLFSSPANEAAEQADNDRENFAVEQEEVPEEPAEPKQGAGTLEALRLMNENMECTITQRASGTEPGVEGTYFVNRGDMRGDFLTESPDLSGQVLSSMIIRDDMLYVWSEIEGEQYGVKLGLDEAKDEETEAGMPVDLNTNIFYDCKPWENIDRTIFEPPEDVLFRDVSGMTNPGMEYGTIYESEGE